MKQCLKWDSLGTDSFFGGIFSYLRVNDGELQELVGLTDDTGSRQLNGIADAVQEAVPRLC